MIIMHVSCFCMHRDSYEAWYLKQMHNQKSRDKRTQEALKKYNPEELSRIIQEMANKGLVVIHKENDTRNIYRSKY